MLAGQLSSVLRTYLWRPSVKNILYLHVCGAYRTLSFPITHDLTILRSIPHFPLMSGVNSMSNFQRKFHISLEKYKKRTKKDLLTHSLAGRLEPCDSANSIITVFREHIQELNESQRSNEKWLEPTVNVLHAFSVGLGELEDFGSVRFRT
jgi:hypothetical protein